MEYHMKEYQWRTKGYCLLNIDAAEQAEFMHKNPSKFNDFGSAGLYEFPTFTCLDKITMNKTLISFVQSLIGPCLLSQSDAWTKTLKGENNDQRMHMDYGNNTFLSPEWNNPEAVAMIVYLSDTEETGGQTAIVPHEDELYKTTCMPGYANYEFYNDKTKAEEYMEKMGQGEFRQKLYDREIKINAKIGDVLVYRLDTWHRGTTVKKPRHVMNLLFKKKECHWINQWNPGFTKKMYRGKLEKLFVSLSPLQKSVLGVPPPGEYWTENRLKLFKKRYPSKL